MDGNLPMIKNILQNTHIDLFYELLNAVETASPWRGHSSGKNSQEPGRQTRGRRGEGSEDSGGWAPGAGRKQLRAGPSAATLEEQVR